MCESHFCEFVEQGDFIWLMNELYVLICSKFIAIIKTLSVFSFEKVITFHFLNGYQFSLLKWL